MVARAGHKPRVTDQNRYQTVPTMPCTEMRPNALWWVEMFNEFVARVCAEVMFLPLSKAHTSLHYFMNTHLPTCILIWLFKKLKKRYTTLMLFMAIQSCKMILPQFRSLKGPNTPGFDFKPCRYPVKRVDLHKSTPVYCCNLMWGTHYKIIILSFNSDILFQPKSAKAWLCVSLKVYHGLSYGMW